MSPTQPLPPKKEVGLALLERSSVYVHLDPRQDTVHVPAWLKKQAQLVLQVGMNMPVAIPDLRFDDNGMSCTLSFNRSPFFCVVPWSSVFAMVGEDGRGMVWPDDVPAEVTRNAQARPAEEPRKDAPKPAVAVVRETRPPREGKPSAPKAKRARKRPALSAVPDGGAKAPAPIKSSSSGGRSSPSPVRPVVAPSPIRPVAGPTRKKRELPPYLRVVK